MTSETMLDHASRLEDGIDGMTLDRYDEAQLDELRFGVICVDRRGTILRYNLAEARLARLDRSKVVGRNFFREVAPCTANEEFEGRFRAFLVSREARIAFDYVFDFKFGAQEVHVEFVRTTSAERVYLCINRMRFRPMRPEFEAVAAPRQAELVPNERDFGVLRDDADQRIVVMPAAALRALRLTWDRIAPKAWGLFAAEWGARWGRLAVLDIETELLEKRGVALGELPLDEALGLLRAHVEQEGWGRLNIDVTSAAASTRGAAIITLERSALAESAGTSDIPRCQLMAGLMRAFLSHISQRLLFVREIRCVAQGAPRCEMIAVAQSRKEQLDEAAARATDAQGVLALLDGAGGPTLNASDVLARLF